MIKSKITLKQLEAFVCVVDVGTFRKAAAVLGTTQPNISARILTLEDSLDVVLMHRDAGSVRLTEKGQALLVAARNVMWSAESFLEEAGRRDLIEERLRLGVSEIVACTWLHAFLRRFREVYPKIAVELQVNLSSEIERDLQAGELDLALQTGPFVREVSGSLSLGCYRYAWVAQPAVADALGKAPSLKSLFGHPILTHARHTSAPRELAARAESVGLPSGRVVHSSSLASCLPMAVDGMGIALLPRQIALGDIKAGRLALIDADWLPEALELYARFDAARVPNFVTFAAELAQDVAGAERVP